MFYTGYIFGTGISIIFDPLRNGDGVNGSRSHGYSFGSRIYVSAYRIFSISFNGGGWGCGGGGGGGRFFVFISTSG